MSTRQTKTFTASPGTGHEFRLPSAPHTSPFPLRSRPTKVKRRKLTSSAASPAPITARRPLHCRRLGDHASIVSMVESANRQLSSYAEDGGERHAGGKVCDITNEGAEHHPIYQLAGQIEANGQFIHILKAKSPCLQITSPKSHP